ncbi:hypothetical protein CVT24_006269 [Panaeolus cyanescens]|uniref:RanBP2-type domain-containing protein n=1 Tax=Panaeolus cyanescens TaxID=181874 RepID=A0A409V8J8_9AGAR|nr:hypothetical protein CVT24_006269 [Panaeolus cyanescens]
MSVIRNSSTRSDTRKKKSSPYGFVSIFKKISSFLGVGDAESSTNDESSSSSSSSGQTSIHTSSNTLHLSRQERYQQLSLSHDRPPLSPVTNPNNASSNQPFPPPSNDNNYQAAASMVSETFGKQVTPAALKDFLSNMNPPSNSDRHESFRFAYTPPPQTPPSAPKSTSSSARRTTLARNPNGSYLWEGGGSAKRSTRNRNRFASPAFRASPSKPSTTDRSTSSDKKRRIDDPSTSDSPNVAPLPFPITASPSTPQSPSKAPHRPAIVTTAPRLRTPVKPTTPVVPSPLRQAWSEVSPTSSPKEEVKKPAVQPPKPTQTATLMSELIKESMPPKKPDLSNPYQTASPVGKVGPPRRSARRPRATNRAPPPNRTTDEELKSTNEKEKEKEIANATAQAIIEATLPKGSKRSRPPANFNKVETPKQSYVVEEVDEDEEPTLKRSKPSLEGRGIPPISRFAPSDDVVVEDLDDDVTMSGPSQEKPKAEPPKLTVPTNVPASRSFKSAAPKEPSKLRFSIQAEAPSSPIPAPVAPPPAQESAPAPKPFVVPNSTFSFTVNASQEKNTAPILPVKKQVAEHGDSPEEVAKTEVQKLPVSSLPVFDLTTVGISFLPNTPDHIEARNIASKAPRVSLPKIDLDGPAKPTSPPTVNGNSAPTKPVTQGFNWSAIGKAPPSSSKDTQKCSTCSLDVPISAVECTICGSPMSTNTSSAPAKDEKVSPPAAPAPAPAPVVAPAAGFNWAALGKAPPSVSQGNKTCGTCMCSTPASEADCTVCGSPL